MEELTDELEVNSPRFVLLIYPYQVSLCPMPPFVLSKPTAQEERKEKKGKKTRRNSSKNTTKY